MIRIWISCGIWSCCCWRIGGGNSGYDFPSNVAHITEPNKSFCRTWTTKRSRPYTKPVTTLELKFHCQMGQLKICKLFYEWKTNLLITLFDDIRIASVSLSSLARKTITAFRCVAIHAIHPFINYALLNFVKLSQLSQTPWFRYTISHSCGKNSVSDVRWMNVWPVCWQHVYNLLCQWQLFVQ